MKKQIIWLLFSCVILLSGCAYQAGYNPTYLPDDEPRYICADEVLLVMENEEEKFVYSGSPSSFTGSATNLTIPLGAILKEVAEEILEDRFSGGTDFSNKFVCDKGYIIALHPSIKHFDYRYNQLRNLGFAITPEVEVDIQVKVLDNKGNTIFDRLYKSGYVSGETYMISGSPAEKINQALHSTVYDLLEQSFIDARPIVLSLINKVHDDDKKP